MTPMNHRPVPDGKDRIKRCQDLREQAARTRADDADKDLAKAGQFGKANGDEEIVNTSFSTSFTKGLPHDGLGNAHPDDYQKFMTAINTSPDQNNHPFDVPLGPQNAPGHHNGSAHTNPPLDFTLQNLPCSRTVKVRGWESPRAGHGYDLQGADAGGLGMAPAPALCSDELVYEMGEVYALALLRDFDFSAIQDADDTPQKLQYSVADVLGALNELDFALDGNSKRRNARLDAAGDFTAFRGSTDGAKSGSYISQFLLLGETECQTATQNNSGRIPYGSQKIDQKVAYYQEGANFMIGWDHWLDVQNGADFKPLGAFAESGMSRFICTPRDLAAYVHDDQLYQAYLNAALILLNSNLGFAGGFPEPNSSGTRTPFATFGGPHLLATITEVSSRALKAVRRQKFNIHRRCRPERIAAMITRIAANQTDGWSETETACYQTMYNQLKNSGLLPLVSRLNKAGHDYWQYRDHAWIAGNNPDWIGSEQNYLLPMAFPEGSPMHPSYGAGHATVAGACITILKAFFNMFTSGDSWQLLSMSSAGFPFTYRGTESGLERTGSSDHLSVSGELDKLAANISIGRNMAGVHFYSDYYDSLRLGERVAVSMLMDQLPMYDEPVCMRLMSFDGDRIIIENQRNAASGSFKAVMNVNGTATPAAASAWRTRHL